MAMLPLCYCSTLQSDNYRRYNNIIIITPHHTILIYFVYLVLRTS